MDNMRMPLQREHKHKKRYSEQEKRDYVQLYWQSKLSKQAFCRQHRIAVSTLYRWLTEKPTASPALTAAPIKPALQWQAIKAPAAAASSVLQLRFEQGLHLTLPTSTDPCWLSTLLLELSRCKFD